MPTKDIQHSIDVQNEHLDARHYVNSPAHARALVKQVKGHVDSLNLSVQDDPLLYAYECRDQLRRFAPLVVQLIRWCDEVIDSTPDQLAESGATLPTLRGS